uniref:Rx N-terminal domain-containing protein n=1 Tax=Solanum tuberosum TaxID=4113 RepID=M1ABY0_SOLTU
MADTVVNFLVENLLQLLSENVALIKGADDEFNNLLEEVQRLKRSLTMLRNTTAIANNGINWLKIFKKQYIKLKM